MSDHNNLEGAPKRVKRPIHWKRIHHTPAFWLGVFFFVGAMAIYVMSDNLALRPSIH